MTIPSSADMCIYFDEEIRTARKAAAAALLHFTL